VAVNRSARCWWPKGWRANGTERDIHGV